MRVAFRYHRKVDYGKTTIDLVFRYGLLTDKDTQDDGFDRPTFYIKNLVKDGLPYERRYAHLVYYIGSVE